MKKVICVLICSIFISTIVFAQDYGLGNVDPAIFTKYRVPETNLRSLFFNTDLSFNSSKYIETIETSSVSSDNFTSNFYYSLEPKYYLLKENDDRVLSLKTSVVGKYQHNKSESGGSLLSSQTDYNLDLNLNSSYSQYLKHSDMFLSTSADVVVSITDFRKDYPGLYSDNGYQGTKNQSYYVDLGFGWGRMRNVTSVVSAVRFQEKMKKMNLINTDLSESAITSLAQQLSRSDYYNNVHVRSEKYFWDDIEKTLSQNGVSLKGINQYGTAFLRETFDELKFMRIEGLRIGSSIQLRYYNEYSSEEELTKISEKLYVVALAYMQYSHQLNLESQIRGYINLSGGPNVIKNSSIKQAYNVILNIGYDYELTDRLVLSAEDTFVMSFMNHNGQDKSFTNALALNMNYFVEDNISLNASYIFNYQDAKYYYMQNEHERSVNHFEMGLTYYLDRGLIFN